MRGNSQVRFLGEGTAATSFPYPTTGEVMNRAGNCGTLAAPRPQETLACSRM